MAGFDSYWYANQWPPIGVVMGAMAGSENPPKSWQLSLLSHTYAFHADLYGKRLDQIDIGGAIGRIQGQPISYYGEVKLILNNYGKPRYEKTYVVYPSQSFVLTFPFIIKEYYRMINSSMSFTITFFGSDYYYHVPTGSYAALQNQRNGEEDQLWVMNGDPPLSGGVHVTDRNDSKGAEWIVRMNLLINPDPPDPSPPIDYMDGPLGCSWKWGVVDGLWPGLIREWIED